MARESYQKHVDTLEQGLAPYAKRSFESFSPTFLNGGDIHEQYEMQWSKGGDRANRLAKRTPLQTERDRILYSAGMRKQTEKHHVLYNGRRRIVRNYITHSMRMAQVVRSICRGLELNSDFAEGIALGSKVGALPFVHASKKAVSEWVVKKIESIDRDYVKNEQASPQTRQQLALPFGKTPLPPWIQDLKSRFVHDRITKYIPWAAGRDSREGYSAGQQGYWQLSANPYTVESRRANYCPEMMFGVWRHTRGLACGNGSFHHRMTVENATSGQHEIEWKHATYEWTTAQYADDITWIIENLNDANSAALLNNTRAIYLELAGELEEQDPPEALSGPLQRQDSGGIYTFFINDFIQTSQSILERLNDGAHFRVALREGNSQATIGLSSEAEVLLDRMRDFLVDRVFDETRVRNRFGMLEAISRACIDLLYDRSDDFIAKYLTEKARLEIWNRDKLIKAQQLAKDPIHRVQLAVNIFSDMGDQEIYDFVGVQSL